MIQLFNRDYIKMCGKKTGDNSRCGSVAVYKAVLKFESSSSTVYRCENHKDTSTVNGKITRTEHLDQEYQLLEVQVRMKDLVGTFIWSKPHAKQMLGMYVKNAGIMCKNRNNQWQYVYYNQVRLQ